MKHPLWMIDSVHAGKQYKIVICPQGLIVKPSTLKPGVLESGHLD